MATEVISTIGTGGDYATIALWEDATDVDLVAADQIQIGELLNEDHAVGAGVVIFGATTNSECYRVLRAQAGAEYNPITGTGARIVTSSGVGRAVTISERGFRLSDVALVITGTVAASASAVYTTSDSVNATGAVALVERCVAVLDSPPSAAYYAFWGPQTSTSPSVVYRNCIAIGDGGTLANWEFGWIVYRKAATSYGLADNCVAYNCETGFRTTEDAVESGFRNCVGASNSTADFANTAGVTSITATNNASSDATAPGTNAVTLITEATAFRDAANNDFRLAKGDTELTGAGADLSTEFTTDFLGRTWRTWSIGAYEPGDLDAQKNGAWESLTYPPLGRVRFFRTRVSGTAGTYTDALEVTGARKVYAYMGNLAGGAVTGGELGFLVDADTVAGSSPFGYSHITPAAQRYAEGAIHGTTEASNIVAILDDPPAHIRIAVGTTVDGDAGTGTIAGTTPDFYIIAEVHY